MSAPPGEVAGAAWPVAAAEAVVTAVDHAERTAEDAGRAVVQPALDLDDLALHLGTAWTGRAADAAARALRRAAEEVDAFSGPLLVVADVLRVEGSALARALVVPGGVADGDARELAEADEALAGRLREVASVLGGEVLGAGAPGAGAGGADTGGLAGVDASVLPTGVRDRATAWHALGPAERARATSSLTGSGALDGLPAAERDVVNRRRLDALIDAGVRPDELGALRAHLAADPRRMLLEVTDDGRAVVADGDPDRAARVVTLVPGTGSSLAAIGDAATRAAEVCTAASAEDAARRDADVAPCVGVAWQGYDAPDTVLEAARSPGLASAHAAELRGLAAGLDAVDRLDGTDTPHTAVGYSFGSVVLGDAAAAPQGLAVDRMLHVGSPGMGTATSADQRIDEGGTPRPVRDEELVGLRSRWDPVPWWSLTGALGGLPGETEVGGVALAAEPGLPPAERAHTHSRYFDAGTDSVRAIGGAVADP